MVHFRGILNQENRSKKASKLRSQKGVMLFELMMSLGLLMLVILMAFYILTAAHQLSEESRGRLLALNAAASVLEVVKETPISSVPAINVNNYIPVDLTNGNIVITTNPGNVAAVQIATVTVTVTWIGPKNRAMNLQMSTMKSQF